MSDIEKLTDWESMALSGIIWVMIKWLNFDRVEMTVEHRNNVESGVWYRIEITKDFDSHKGHADAYIDGQRSEIVKRRLIEYLDKNDYRKKTVPNQ